MCLVGRKLLIISHTPHARNAANRIVGWGPTISEINFLAQFWKEVVHVGCLSDQSDDSSMQAYERDNIRFSPIPEFGGKSILKKINILTNAPRIIYRIIRELKGTSHVQIRVPMGIGVYVLPLFWFYPRRFILWVKYANNWEHVSNSIVYRFQRWLLKKDILKCCVTINGFWLNQSTHLKSFENPCISNSQFQLGGLLKKDFNGPFKLVFAGRIESAKGIDILIQALPKLPHERIQEWTFLGDGTLREDLKSKLDEQGIDSKFLGFVSQQDVHNQLKNAHFLILPSKSEGFPKVVAEAWNYGCIPIVSSVGSLPHYVVQGENGFLLSELSSNGLYAAMHKALTMSRETLNEISRNGNDMASRFTFDYYIHHLKKDIFNDN